MIFDIRPSFLCHVTLKFSEMSVVKSRPLVPYRLIYSEMLCVVFQLFGTRSESRKWTSVSQPASRRPSTASAQLGPDSCLQYTFDDLLHCQQSPMNGFSALSQLDLSTAVHSLPPTPDLYTDFAFLLDRLEVPLASGSRSSGMVPVTTSPALSNRGLSLSPLCFTQSQSRSRSNSASPDAAVPSDTSVKHDAQNDARAMAGGKAQKIKIPRHKRPSHQRAEVKRRTRIQVNLIFSSFHLF